MLLSFLCLFLSFVLLVVFVSGIPALLSLTSPSLSPSLSPLKNNSLPTTFVCKTKNCQAAGLDVKERNQLETRMRLAEKEAADLRQNQTLLHEERRKLKALASFQGSLAKKRNVKKKKKDKTEFMQQRSQNGDGIASFNANGKVPV